MPKQRREREPLWKHTTRNTENYEHTHTNCKYCHETLLNTIQTVRHHFKNDGCKSIDVDSNKKVQLILSKTKMEEYAKQKAKNTITIKYGSDKNKLNNADKAITLGANTYVARQCSSHIRTVYSQSILQDDMKDEFCVNGRDDEY
eukprot:66980_1